VLPRRPRLRLVDDPHVAHVEVTRRATPVGFAEGDGQLLRSSGDSVLSAHATRREQIVPCADDERCTRPDSSWAALMKHSFGLDVLKCPRCDGGWLKFVAVLHDREEVRRLLEHLALWAEPLPLHPARGPPDQHETFDFC
jgi:Zn-finger nucleic acid-binding protein